MTTELANKKTERISLGITAIAKARENNEAFWKMKADLISLSRMGAGFYLQKECQVGQLISLLLPMPKHLRQYDEDKELYRVWGVVQHCNKLASDDDYHIGVAFIGKNPPETYYHNTQQSYRIIGMNEQGLWNLTEIGRTFVNRRHPRFWVSTEVELEAIDENNKFISDLKAETENISLSGAAVFSHLKVDVGDSIKFICNNYDFSTMAIVRNRQAGDEIHTPKLHLEFLDGSFPVEKIVSPFEDEKEN